MNDPGKVSTAGGWGLTESAGYRRGEHGRSFWVMHGVDFRDAM